MQQNNLRTQYKHTRYLYNKLIYISILLTTLKDKSFIVKSVEIWTKLEKRFKEFWQNLRITDFYLKKWKICVHVLSSSVDFLNTFWNAILWYELHPFIRNFKTLTSLLVFYTRGNEIFSWFHTNLFPFAISLQDDLWQWQILLVIVRKQ